MVSFHKVLDENPKAEVPAELEASSKKKRWEEPLTQELFQYQSNAEKRNSIFDKELHLETPLPSHKWQQYLSIQVCIYSYMYTVKLVRKLRLILHIYLF